MQTIPKQMLRIQLQPHEQMVDVPIVLAFRAACQKSIVLIAEVVQVLRVDVQYVDVLNSWRRVGSITRVRLMTHC